MSFRITSLPIQRSTTVLDETDEKNPIRVFIADDHALIRQGLTNVIDHYPEFVLVGEACDGAGTVAGCRQLRPEVAIVDLFMPDSGGIEVTRQILDSHQDTKVVILTANDSSNYILDVLRAGAVNYVLKNISVPTLANVIRAAADNRMLITQETSQILIAAVRKQSRQHRIKPSQREQAILDLMKTGHSNASIAKVLGISISTVKRHISNLYKKLAVSSRTEAVVRASEGIIDTER